MSDVMGENRLSEVASERFAGGWVEEVVSDQVARLSPTSPGNGGE